MNGFQVKSSSSKDRRGIALIASFYNAEGGETPFAARHCSDVVKCHGTNPSYFACGVGMKGLFGAGNWDKTPGVALTTNFAGKVKLLARASAGYRENGVAVTLVNGWVVSHGHSIKEDSVSPITFDDRHIMASYFTCLGKMMYDIETGKHYFVSNPNDPLVFNKWGHGDCVDTPYGPRFATGHRVGHLATGDLDPSDDPAPGTATAKTRKWRVKDILRYLRDFFYEISNRPPLVQDYGKLELPKKYLTWSKSLGNNIVENKTPHNFDLQGANLLEALVKTIGYAGPYELNLEPITAQRSVLEVIDFSKRANTGVRIFGPKYFGNDLAAVADNPNVAEDGYIKQSVLGYAPSVVQIGDSPCIEFMASTDPADADCFASSLSVGWAAAELTIFRNRVEQSTNGASTAAETGRGDALYFDFAAKESPSVFSYFKLTNTKNPFALSKYGERTESGNFRILPHQLSSYNNNAQSPLGLVPREIVVEIKMTNAEYARYQDALTGDEVDLGPWRVASRYSELQLSPCGRFIQLPGLRDNAQRDSSLNGTWVAENIDEDGFNIAGTYGGRYMVARHVRIQVVAQSDHALVSKRGDNTDPNETAIHIASDAPKLSLLMLNHPMQYVDWLRRNQSYPLGIGGKTTLVKAALALQFQPKQSAGNELWSDHIGDGDITNPKNRLDNHTQKFVDNLKRIMFEGHFQIGRMTPVYHIGQYITYDNGPGPLPGVGGVVKCIVISSSSQKTKVEIGPPSFSTIWDGPLAIYSNAGGSGGALPETPKTDKYDDPYQDKAKTTSTEKTGADYLKTAEYEASANGGRAPAAGSAGPIGPTGNAAEKPMSRHENRQANMQKDIDEKREAGDEKGAQAVERQQRKEAEKNTNREQRKADKKAQRSNRGSYTTADGKTVGAGDLNPFGKAGSGAMTDASGKVIMQAGDVGNGRMFDSSKVDKYDRDQFNKNKQLENRGVVAANAAAQGRKDNRDAVDGKRRAEAAASRDNWMVGVKRDYKAKLGIVGGPCAAPAQPRAPAGGAVQNALNGTTKAPLRPTRAPEPEDE